MSRPPAAHEFSRLAWCRWTSRFIRRSLALPITYSRDHLHQDGTPLTWSAFGLPGSPGNSGAKSLNRRPFTSLDCLAPTFARHAVSFWRSRACLPRWICAIVHRRSRYPANCLSTIFLLRSCKDNIKFFNALCLYTVIMKERLHIHVTIMQASPQEQQLPPVLVREKQGFFTTFANLLYAALAEDDTGWERAKEAAERIMLTGGWKEYLTTLDAVRMREPRGPHAYQSFPHRRLTGRPRSFPAHSEAIYPQRA